MKTLALALCLLALTASPGWADGVQLSIRNGRVTLDAQNVTVRQILAEWARIGRTRILNGERISGGPVTLKLEDVPEKQALDVVLRAIPGYVAQPRQALVADASIYDQILIMPTTVAVAARPQPAARFPGVPPGGANLTQLRPMPPRMLSPGALPEPPDQSGTQGDDDPAIAAAAAAGLIPVPATGPSQAVISGPLLAPAGPQPPATQPQPAQTPGTVAVPSNPFNTTAGTSTPTFTPPPPPPAAATTVPITRTRPPQPDR